MVQKRLQKLLAETGIGSRRQIEQWIAEGGVVVNGRTAQLGDKVDSDDAIYVSGVPVVYSSQTPPRVLLYHKPVGEVVSRNDPERRPTIFDRLPNLPYGRWISIGRLDIATSGVLLVSTDGQLAHRMMHPSSELEREYLVRVAGPITDDTLNQLRTGVMLEDGVARFKDLQRHRQGEGRNMWFRVTVCEGRNRLVRRLWLEQGVVVSRLIRLRFGSCSLPRELPAGSYQELKGDSLVHLYDTVGLSLPTSK